MTAVEFLYQRLERMIPRTALYNMDKEDYFKQAKDMEKTNLDNKAIHFAEWLTKKHSYTLMALYEHFEEQYYNKEE